MFIKLVQRNLLSYVRSKGRVFGTLFMSMFMLVMFSFLMKSSMGGVDSPMNYLISGVVIMSVFQTSVNNSSDIPTTIIPGFLLPIVYLNPLTYTTSIFRFVALGAHTLSTEELVSQGMAFSIGGFVITPLMGLGITLLIGAFFFTLCVRKFDRADFSTIKIAARMQGGGPPAR